MELYEKSIAIPRTRALNTFDEFSSAIEADLPEGHIPVRFVVTETTADNYHCEIGVLEGGTLQSSLFQWRQRHSANGTSFNVAHIIPTGIGCRTGGHVDGGATARILSSVCDQLITHPNVVNAADINEMSENTLYVEGSILSRLMMGMVGVQPAKNNRVLVLADRHTDEQLSNALINSINAARACYGFNCPEIVMMEDRIAMNASLSDSGRAVGSIKDFDNFINVLKDRKGQYDAVAVTTLIQVTDEVRRAYYTSDHMDDDKVNPWGGVEAMLTHTISMMFDVPTAHSPMEESEAVSCWDPGITDPRLAAESVSVAYLQCILKGLQRSPKIITKEIIAPGVLTARDVSALVTPVNALGLAVIAALRQGIPVIAVRENSNIMKNDLNDLPWAPGQYHEVENYWEAAGFLSALKDGIDPYSVRRPLDPVRITVV